MVLYNIVYLIALLIYLPLAVLKGKYSLDYLFMRQGGFDRSTKERLRLADRIIWVHAVSVGEMASVGKLVKLLKTEFGDCSILFTSVTRTGNEIAKRLARKQDFVGYLPWDLPWATGRIIKDIRPELFILLETEIWPNLISSLAAVGVPIAIANGRISQRSYRRYRRIRFFISGVLKKIDLFCMQSELYARRIISLGAAEERVRVCGNLKFDLDSEQSRDFEPRVERLRKALGVNPDDKLFIAGSTHPKEEAAILKLYKRLKNADAQLRLLLAPRHIKRADEIARLVKIAGYKPLRISRLLKGRMPCGPDSVFILDTIGDLTAAYKLALVVFVGGSLVPRGGQNIIEPARFKKAVCFGPHMDNFSDVAEAFLQQGAMLMVKDGRDLEAGVSRIITQASYRQAMGERAQQVVLNNQGASERILDAIKGILTN